MSLMTNSTHWGRVTHICVSKLTIIGSDNGFSPDRRQAIIWTNAGFLLIGPLGRNFSEILIEILTFSFNKMRLKVSSAKRRPFCLGLNVLTRKRLMFMRHKQKSSLTRIGYHSRREILSDQCRQRSLKCKLKRQINMHCPIPKLINAPVCIRYSSLVMMTSSNGNMFRVIGHLCGEFTGPRWIPRTNANDAELWYLLWSAPE